MNSSYKLLLVASAIGLGSCSYQPLYSTSASGKRVADQLLSVSVEQQNSRTGQLIRNEIISSIGASNTATPSRYRLGFISTAKDADTVKSFGSDILRKSYQLSVKYHLVDTSNGKIVHKGNTFAHVSYDKTAAPFADYRAKISAQERAAKEVGTDIRTRLAAYFSSH